MKMILLLFIVHVKMAHLDIVKHLLSQRSDPNCKDKNSSILLHLLCALTNCYRKEHWMMGLQN